MSSYLRVLREQNFRYLFLGQAASMVGDRVVVVALALFITQRTGSPTDLGLVLAAQTRAARRRCSCSAACGPTGSRATGS